MPNMQTTHKSASVQPRGAHTGSAYHAEIRRLYRFLVPKNSRVLSIGAHDPQLLSRLSPSWALGLARTETEAAALAEQVDASAVEYAFRAIPDLSLDDIEPVDYVIIPDYLPLVRDVQALLTEIRKVCSPSTRIILNFRSNVWRPLLTLATALGIRERVADYNWLSSGDILNLLNLSGMEPVTDGGRVLLPFKIPLLSGLANRLLAKLPLFRLGCLTWFIVARPTQQTATRPTEPSVSVLIPTRNERGNIEDAFKRTPHMGAWTELVFVDGHSDDGTVEEIERCTAAYAAQWPRVKVLAQTGTGKGQAVRQGFEECEGDILMILDSDLTMPPEDLPKYYQAIVHGKGEFINGCRLVYPQEDEAMRFLNMLGNHFFAKLFTWLLGQRVKDTLCGTKVLWRDDYERIADNREYFGDFDPFGDFDLLFGAAKLNRKIVDLPIRYRERTYGEIKIDRWRDGMLLLRMSWIAFRRLKLS